MEMYVKERAARSWRQVPIEVQTDLALGVAHLAQRQDLSGVLVPDCHGVIHDCPPFDVSAPKKLPAIIGPSAGGEPSAEGDPWWPLGCQPICAFEKLLDCGCPVSKAGPQWAIDFHSTSRATGTEDGIATGPLESIVIESVHKPTEN